MNTEIALNHNSLVYSYSHRNKASFATNPDLKSTTSYLTYAGGEN